MAVTLPNVTIIKGATYFHFKASGKKRYIRLPDVSDPKFAIALQKARSRRDAAHKNPEAAPKDSFAALIHDYRDSPDYKQLVQSTREAYDRYLVMIETRIGQRAVRDINIPRIIKIRNEMQSTPGKANGWLNTLRSVLWLGTQLGYCDRNYAADVDMLKVGEHQPWPAEVIERVLDAATPMVRLAILTALYSGQRISDIIRFTHTQVSEDLIHLRQAKRRSNGARFVDVYIPVHPAWREAVAAVPRRCETVLYNRHGKPFGAPDNLQERLRVLVKSLGYVDARGENLYSFHGLRKNSTNYLAEMGLTPHEIGAINGMTIETVTHYTRGVGKARLAGGARDRMLASDPSKRSDRDIDKPK